MGIRYTLRGEFSTDDNPFPKLYRVYDTGEVEEDDSTKDDGDSEAWLVYKELVAKHKGGREWRITLEEFENECRKYGIDIGV